MGPAYEVNRTPVRFDRASDTFTPDGSGLNCGCACQTGRRLASIQGNFGGSAWTAAAASFSVFTIGAIFPVIPFFMLHGQAAVIASVALSGLALYASGAVTSIFTGRSLILSGLRQLAIGLTAAAVTYSLGRLLRVSIA